MPVLPKLHRLWDTVLAIFSVGSWPTKEVVVPDLPLPLPRTSNLPSITSNSLPRRRSKARHNHRRALMEGTSLEVL
jgi:hypothetical protein